MRPSHVVRNASCDSPSRKCASFHRRCNADSVTGLLPPGSALPPLDTRLTRKLPSRAYALPRLGLGLLGKVSDLGMGLGNGY